MTARRSPPRARPARVSTSPRRATQGFTFLGLMFLIAVMGIVAAAAGTTWRFASQRDKERELLFAGHAYRVAIERYAAAHARSPHRYPTAIAQLLQDGSSLAPMRYLRRAYFDPMTGSTEWGLVKTADGGITGVYSLSTQQPIRTKAPLVGGEGIDFVNAKSYRDWVFGVAAAVSPQNGDAPVVPGWNYERDGSPPQQWDAAHPQPGTTPE